MQRVILVKPTKMIICIIMHKNRMEITGEKRTTIHVKRHNQVKSVFSMQMAGILVKTVTLFATCVWIMGEYWLVTFLRVPNVSLSLPLPVKMTTFLKSSAFATT